MLEIPYGVKHIQLSCPHCYTDRAAFTYVGCNDINETTKVSTTFYSCNCCGKGVGVSYKLVPVKIKNSFSAYKNTFKQITGIYPEPIKPDIPEHLDEKIQKLFMQADDNLKRSNFDSAGMTSRKILEVFIKNEYQQTTGFLAQRIKQIKDLPESMIKWAETIKDLGNEAAHDIEEFNEESANQIFYFCKMFLTYMVTMPKEVELLKKQSEIKK